MVIVCCFFTGVYCCAIFCIIGISVLETILVNYLKAKGAKKRSVETTAAVSGQDGKNWHNIRLRGTFSCILYFYFTN